LTPDQIRITEGTKTQGLRPLKFENVEFRHIRVGSHALGNVDTPDMLRNELVNSSKIHHGAAVCGFLKRLIAELCEYANKTIVQNARLADDPAMHKAMSDASMRLYLLETVVYYLGGLSDEGLYLVNDLENPVLQFSE
jgi:alkylation response protein AidB-like acyl-CoA dehydrogenase